MFRIPHARSTLENKENNTHPINTEDIPGTYIIELQYVIYST